MKKSLQTNKDGSFNPYWKAEIIAHCLGLFIMIVTVILNYFTNVSTNTIQFLFILAIFIPLGEKYVRSN